MCPQEPSAPTLTPESPPRAVRLTCSQGSMRPVPPERDLLGEQPGLSCSLRMSLEAGKGTPDPAAHGTAWTPSGADPSGLPALWLQVQSWCRCLLAGVRVAPQAGGPEAVAKGAGGARWGGRRSS